MRRHHQDRILDRVLGQGRVAGSAGGDLLGGLLAERDAQAVVAVKGDGVAVGKGKGRGVGPAVGTADGFLADAPYDSLGIERAAFGALACHIGVAQEAAGHHYVVAGRGGERRDGNVLDAQDNGVADFGPRHGDGLGDLVAAANFGRDHGPPTAGSRVGDDVPAVTHGAEHGQIGVQNAVGVLVDKDGFVAGCAGGGAAILKGSGLDVGCHADPPVEKVDKMVGNAD